MDDTAFFTPRSGCPFCGRPGAAVLCRVRYHDTAEANRDLPDIEGTLFECPSCGVAFPSHVYVLDAFPQLYRKSLADLSWLDASALQRARVSALTAILRSIHRPASFSRLLDALTLGVLQVPRHRRAARGARVLDVGCGFGEFSRIYRALGARVTSTEIIPALAARLRAEGLDCRTGELETLEFGDEAFDIIVLRAVFYRTRDPDRTLRRLAALLAPGGESALVDACPGRDGVAYFSHKHFPQGQFYIVDVEAYLRMVCRRYGLKCREARLIHGRPMASLKPVGPWRVATRLMEMLAANACRWKPFMLSYTLVAAPVAK